MRFLRFNIVGVLGFGVQLGVLTVLGQLGWTPAMATFVAVEAAVLHNFVWHERWTWTGARRGSRLGRLARFQLSNGLVSLAVNVALTAMLTAVAGLPLAAANAIAVGACALTNYASAARFVYGGKHQAARA